MKYSQYNSILKLSKEHTLIYNSLSDTFIAHKGNLVIPDRPETLRETDNQFYNQLIKAKAIIDDNVDEVTIVEKLIHENDFNEKVYILHINPTLDCNFRCWYCYENHQQESKMTKETVDRVIKHVQNILKEKKSLTEFRLSFFGGEPLLQFNDVVVPLIEQIAKLCSLHRVSFSISFTSNGFLLTRSITSYLSNYQTSFQITLDGGREMHNRTRFTKGGGESFDTILANIHTLIRHSILVVLRINYTSKNIESVGEIIDNILSLSDKDKSYLTVDLQRVWQDIDDSVPFDTAYQKAKEFRMILKKANVRVTNSRTLDSVKNSCYGDKKNHLLINYNGDIFTCTARDFTSENRYGILDTDGSIILDHNKYEHRMSCRFTKEICHKCRIAPRCGGTCRTKSMERESIDICNCGYSKENIDELILEIFEERFLD